jgi:hypothetical protein
MAVPAPGLGTLYGVLKDLRIWFRRRYHKLTPEERLERREKWKERFREEIWKTEEQELRQDVIVRDVRRLDQYPDGLDGKGISPWFRVALVGQYHRGILLGLRLHSLVFQAEEGTEGAWRLADINETAPTTKGYLIGYVRYDDIEQVDWYGDEFYNFPHIFCHFSHGGQPYEKLAFCERKSILAKHYFYTEFASYEEVKLTSQKYGTSKWEWG